VRCFFVAGMIASGEAVYYRFSSGVTEAMLNILRQFHRITNKRFFFVTAARLATQ
jgi:hypothetical protein